jgi:hypothetical protein
MSKVVFEKNGLHQPVKNVVGSGLPVELLGGGASDGAIVDGVDSGIKATVKDYANANPVTVVLVDTAGDPYVASGSAATPPATAARTQVADSAVAVSLIASNASRKGLVITNDSSARLFVGYGTVDPTTTNYTFVLLSGQTWEMTPANVFTGQLKGIWESDPNDGAARITELTA